MVSSGMTSLLWFIAIIVMIPAVLWLLKRTPVGGAASNSLMRSVAVLPLSQNQRVVTIEVGQGDDRQWLVLGVTPQQITTLHTMAPQAEPAAPMPTHIPPFAQMLYKARVKVRNKGASNDSGEVR